AARQVRPTAAKTFESDPGLGVWGAVDGKRVLVGNLRLMQRNGVDVAELAERADQQRARGATAIYVAVDARVAGLLVIADAIKSTTPDALEALKNLDVGVVMLTGDDDVTAKAVAAELGVDEVFADVLPPDKAAIVQRFQHDGVVVAMAGDGVNDAPAL